MKRKHTILDYVTRHEEAHRNNKIKIIIDFHQDHTSSIKSLVVEKKSSVLLTTRFMKVKMLMFAKISLYSFIYDVTNVFCFTDKVVRKIYEKYKKQSVSSIRILQIQTGLHFFFFICDINCIINEKESRNILFEVMVQSKILERLDLSYDFGQKLIVQNDDDTMRGHLIHHQKYAYTSRLKHYLTIFMH